MNVCVVNTLCLDSLANNGTSLMSTGYLVSTSGTARQKRWGRAGRAERAERTARRRKHREEHIQRDVVKKVKRLESESRKSELENSEKPVDVPASKVLAAPEEQDNAKIGRAHV